MAGAWKESLAGRILEDERFTEFFTMLGMRSYARGSLFRRARQKSFSLGLRGHVSVEPFVLEPISSSNPRGLLRSATIVVHT